MPRRRPGQLLPLEIEILQTAVSMQSDTGRGFHGFALARAMRREGGRGLLGHGTLYKALGRMEEMGLLTSEWEHAPPPGRPRRRLYEVTPAGAVQLARSSEPDPAIHGDVAPRTT